MYMYVRVIGSRLYKPNREISLALFELFVRYINSTRPLEVKNWTGLGWAELREEIRRQNFNGRRE